MWILDTFTSTEKISPIQVAILFICSESRKVPKKIPEIIDLLQQDFQNLWIPQKGTIYPAIHNLNIRGLLKLHAIKPYGYSLTVKGLELIKKIMANFHIQSEAFFQYVFFLLKKYQKIDNQLILEFIHKEILQLNVFNEKLNTLVK